jgi:hypothetical protein
MTIEARHLHLARTTQVGGGACMRTAILARRHDGRQLAGIAP